MFKRIIMVMLIVATGNFISAKDCPTGPDYCSCEVGHVKNEWKKCEVTTDHLGCGYAKIGDHYVDSNGPLENLQTHCSAWLDTVYGAGSGTSDDKSTSDYLQGCIKANGAVDNHDCNELFKRLSD